MFRKIPKSFNYWKFSTNDLKRYQSPLLKVAYCPKNFNFWPWKFSSSNFATNFLPRSKNILANLNFEMLCKVSNGKKCAKIQISIQISSLGQNCRIGRWDLFRQKSKIFLRKSYLYLGSFKMEKLALFDHCKPWLMQKILSPKKQHFVRDPWPVYYVYVSIARLQTNTNYVKDGYCVSLISSYLSSFFPFLGSKVDGGYSHENFLGLFLEMHFCAEFCWRQSKNEKVLHPV